jgi:outer membrane lipoprotein LolB
MKPAYLKFFAALLVAASLVGCAQLPSPSGEQVPVPAPSLAGRACHDHITLGGRFSLQYSLPGGESSAHGSFELIQQGANVRLTLLSPLGQGIAVIEVTPDEATLTPAGKVSRSAPDAESLAIEMLGWPLPVSDLRDWLQGCMRDAQGKRHAVAPASGEVTTPGGWRIAYPDWERGSAASRPKRIDLKHSGDRLVTDISMRLVIDTWQPGR